MPIIFAQAIMFVPITIVGFSESEALQGLAATLTDFSGFGIINILYNDCWLYIFLYCNYSKS